MSEHVKHRYFFTGEERVTYQYEVYANSEREARINAFFHPYDSKIINADSEGDENDLKLVYTDTWDEESETWVANPKHVCAKCGSELPFPEYQGKYWCRVDQAGPYGKIIPASDLSLYMKDSGVEFCPKCVNWLWAKMREMGESTKEEENELE